MNISVHFLIQIYINIYKHICTFFQYRLNETDKTSQKRDVVKKSGKSQIILKKFKIRGEAPDIKKFQTFQGSQFGI